MKKLVSALALAFSLTSLAACSVPVEDTRRVVAGQGYKDVVVGSRRWVFTGCSKDDELNRSFTATDQSGNRVTGVVCGGIFFKSYTVRVD